MTLAGPDSGKSGPKPIGRSLKGETMNRLQWPGTVSIAAVLLATASSQTLAQRVGMGRAVVQVNGPAGYQIGGSIGMGQQALMYGVGGYQTGGCVGMGQVQI